MAGSGRRGARLVTGALLVATTVAGSPSAAHAHGDDPTVGVVLDEVVPAPEGVTVQVAHSVSAQLVAQNTTDTELVVLAATGEPFLRISTAGVLANLASPSWYLGNSPTGAPAIPDGVDPAAEPRWALVTREPSWGWFDHRLHPERPTPGRAEGEARTLARWRVPMRYGDTDLVARGRIVRRARPATTEVRVRRVEQSLEGLTVSVLAGAVPGVFAGYTGTEPVVVIGALGEPFARLGPGGVEVNLHSPTWIENARSRDQDVSGLVADAAASPEWSTVGTSPTLAWLDLRGQLPEGRRRATWRIRFERGEDVAVLVAETRRVRSSA